MFDDPKKKLRELEDQLLAAEENEKFHAEQDAEFQKIYEEVLAEFGSVDAPEQEPPIRNFANGYGKDFHRPMQKPVEIPVKIPDPEPVQPREHSGFLTFLFCVECLAIAGVAVFWLVNAL